MFRWSHDGKFFARMSTDTLSIYETPVSFYIYISSTLSKQLTSSWVLFCRDVDAVFLCPQSMGLLDKKSLKINGIKSVVVCVSVCVYTTCTHVF